jgi:arginine repressor
MLSEEIYPGPRDIFSTNVMEETRVVVGENIDKMKSQQGHIVIRVNPGGDSYNIFILDDSAENYLVKAVFGPYSSN